MAKGAHLHIGSYRDAKELFHLIRQILKDRIIGITEKVEINDL